MASFEHLNRERENDMRAVNILCVCGSGTATSAMLSAKLRDVLDEQGYQCDTDETNPPGISTMLLARNWDIIAYTSPLEEEYEIPTLNATGFLVGINEDEFVEELMDAVGRLNLDD